MEKKTFKPIGPYILVKPEEAETTTKSGMVIVEKEPERPQKGKVVSLGGGIVLPNGQVTQFSVKEGETIYFKKYGGTELELDGEKYLILTENDILGIFE